VFQNDNFKPQTILNFRKKVFQRLNKLKKRFERISKIKDSNILKNKIIIWLYSWDKKFFGSLLNVKKFLSEKARVYL